MLALRFNYDTLVWDFVESEDGRGYETDEGLWTLGAMTILSEAPDETKTGFEKSGYWGDLVFEDGHRFGSKMWTLYGRELSPDTAKKAKFILEEAFAYWITDGIAESIVVTVELDQSNERLDFQVEAYRGDTEAPLWTGHWTHTLEDANGLVPAEAA